MYKYDLDCQIAMFENLEKSIQLHKNKLHFYDSKIVYFLWGKGTDNRNRHLSDLWKKGYFFLEICHDYIQWIFPLNEESKHNPKTPVLTEEEVAMIRSNEKIQENMLRSLDVMLQFYGLERDGKKIRRGSNFDKRQRWWLTKNNHNYLRITRILKSLKLCGLQDYARAFLEELGQIYLEYPVISDETFAYWDIERK
ncbi:opioid growth factor receptor-related protein [Faecalimonas sp.]